MAAELKNIAKQEAQKEVVIIGGDIVKKGSLTTESPAKKLMADVTNRLT